MNREKIYLEQCDVLAKNSKCLSRKIGAIIVKDKTIIGSGYNGPPRDFPHCNERWLLDSNFIEECEKRDIDSVLNENTCPRQLLGYKSGEGLEWCVAGHAERNAIVNSARIGISTIGATMYMNCPVPCSPCLVEIINAGIVEIVFTDLKVYDISGLYILENSNLMYRTYDV